jgi:hypothetical protein
VKSDIFFSIRIAASIGKKFEQLQQWNMDMEWRCLGNYLFIPATCSLMKQLDKVLSLSGNVEILYSIKLGNLIVRILLQLSTQIKKVRVYGIAKYYWDPSVYHFCVNKVSFFLEVAM